MLYFGLQIFFHCKRPKLRKMDEIWYVEHKMDLREMTWGGIDWIDLA
jgi:hypothetical protein